MSQPNNPFEQDKEFPNFFKQVALALQNAGTSKQESYLKVIALLERNFDVILNRLQIPYVTPATDRIQSDLFFAKLEEVAQGVIDKWNEEHPDAPQTVKLYIGGGVVRSILAYIYNEMRKIIENELGNSTADRKSSNLARELAKAKAAGFEVQTGPGSLAEFMRDEIGKPEFHMLRGATLRDETQLYNLFVLGVGSDLDIYYDLKPGNPELSNKLEKATQDFINSAEKLFNLFEYDDAIKKSLVPVADVKPRNEQLHRTVQQGGATTDWLSFELGDKGRILQPEFFKGIDLLSDFIDGFYHYLDGQTQDVQKQAIRGLRALLELPFLSIKDVSIIKKHLAQLDFNSMSEDAKEQIQKLIRNAYASAANNRAHREVNGLLKILAENKLIPVFLENKPINNQRRATGKNLGMVNSKLIDIDTFLDNFCAKINAEHVLHHGTPIAENMINIIRGGFIISSGQLQQGLSLFGSGLYTTPDKNTAIEYSMSQDTGKAGHVFDLKIAYNPAMRILNLLDLTQREQTNLQQEATSKGYSDVNELLSKEYNIDIVINRHVILQNINVIEPLSLPDILEILLAEVWVGYNAIIAEKKDFDLAFMQKADHILNILKLLDPARYHKILSDISNGLKELLQSNLTEATDAEMLSNVSIVIYKANDLLSFGLITDNDYKQLVRELERYWSTINLDKCTANVEALIPFLSRASFTAREYIKPEFMIKITNQIVSKLINTPPKLDIDQCGEFLVNLAKFLLKLKTENSSELEKNIELLIATLCKAQMRPDQSMPDFLHELSERHYLITHDPTDLNTFKTTKLDEALSKYIKNPYLLIFAIRDMNLEDMPSAFAALEQFDDIYKISILKKALTEAIKFDDTFPVKTPKELEDAIKRSECLKFLLAQDLSGVIDEARILTDALWWRNLASLTVLLDNGLNVNSILSDDNGYLKFELSGTHFFSKFSSDYKHSLLSIRTSESECLKLVCVRYAIQKYKINLDSALMQSIVNNDLDKFNKCLEENLSHAEREQVIEVINFFRKNLCDYEISPAWLYVSRVKAAFTGMFKTCVPENRNSLGSPEHKQKPKS